MFVWQKRLKRSVGIFLILMLVFSSCLIAAPFQSLAAAEESPGVLILAHGAGDPTWTVPLWEAANELKENLPYPVAIGFLEYDEPDIPDAVEQLNWEIPRPPCPFRFPTQNVSWLLSNTVHRCRVLPCKMTRRVLRH